MTKFICFNHLETTSYAKMNIETFNIMFSEMIEYFSILMEKNPRPNFHYFSPFQFSRIINSTLPIHYLENFMRTCSRTQSLLLRVRSRLKLEIISGVFFVQYIVF